MFQEKNVTKAFVNEKSNSRGSRKCKGYGAMHPKTRAPRSKRQSVSLRTGGQSNVKRLLRA